MTKNRFTEGSAAQYTAFRHAHRIAALMGAPLMVILENRPYDRAILAMLLFCLGYSEAQIRDVMAMAGPWNSNFMREVMDLAINLYRGEISRKLQYRIIYQSIITHADLDEEQSRTGTTGSNAASRGEEVEKGDARTVALAPDTREVPALRISSADPARQTTAPIGPPTPHRQHLGRTA